jgi:enterochelin esterase-like enzyme
MFRTLEFSNGSLSMEGLTFLTVKSRALRGRADITVYVPRQAHALTDVPLVTLLHGAYGSHWAWSVKGKAHQTLQRLIDARHVPPMILAMPSDGLWGDGTAYLTQPERDVEKWIVQEVPAAVSTVLREPGFTTLPPCVSPASPLFLGGLSMGGFGALRIGAKYGGRYRGLSAHSSITHFEQMAKFVEEDLARYQAPTQDYSVLETMLRHRATLPPFRFDCGAADTLIGHSRQLHVDLNAHGIPHSFEEFEGGHDWGYWEKHLEDTLVFFGKLLSGPSRV